MLNVINMHYHYINSMLVILNSPEFMPAWLAFLGKIAINYHLLKTLHAADHLCCFSVQRLLALTATHHLLFSLSAD